MKKYLKINKNTFMLFLGLLFTPYLALANDPFDNTIFTFDNNVQTTEQLGTSSSQDMTSQQNESVALDHPINTRYAITSYSLRGLIKSPNKTQLMFVAENENVKFLLTIKDCLGLNCAYVTDIDKRGRVTFEDEEGIYRFQVGYAPFVVENKLTEDMAEEEALENELVAADSETSEIVEADEDLLNLEKMITSLDENILILEAENESLLMSNTSIKNDFDKLTKDNQSLKNEIQELQASINVLESELQAKDQSLNDVTNDLNIKDQQIASLRKELETSLKTELEDSSEETSDSVAMDSIKIENDELQENINSLKLKIDEIKNNHETVLSDLKNTLKEKNEMISDLQVQLLFDATPSEESNSDSITLQEEPDVQEETVNKEDEEPEESENTQSSDITKRMIAKEDVNIRGKPTPESSIVSVLMKNDGVNVVGEVDGWYKVILEDNVEGYIYAPMLVEEN